jgi:3D-(3,5/4)-trihydroxycyclohexane-1,2-dione acylhydrolase (decyclizing)
VSRGLLRPNKLAREVDLIIGIGTRYSDFTTASVTAFQTPAVRFININVTELDAAKHSGLALLGDARAVVEELQRALEGHAVSSAYACEIAKLKSEWEKEVDRIYNRRVGPPLSQGEVVGILNSELQPRDVIVNAAGSLPGDPHKLWRTRHPKGYHMEYGYSCMGYEIAGGLGVKMDDASREVYVLVGDGSYLMLAQEIVTAVQESIKLNILVLDNHGCSSIGWLSRACGSGGFGTEYRYRNNGKQIPVDFVANAASLGAHAVRATSHDELKSAIRGFREQKTTSVVVVETDYNDRVPGYDSWWDVAIAEVSHRAVRCKRLIAIMSRRANANACSGLPRRNDTFERLRNSSSVSPIRSLTHCAD